MHIYFFLSYFGVKIGYHSCFIPECNTGRDFIDSLYKALRVRPSEIKPPLSQKWRKKIQTDKNWLVQLPNRTLVGFTFWTFRPIGHNHPHGENSVAAITFPEKYVHLILHLFMDIYVPHFIQQGCQNVENSQTHWKRVIIYLGKIGGAHVPCHFAKWQCNVFFSLLTSLISVAQHKVVFSISYTDIFQKSNYR